jgi:hypothetical protein
MKLHEILANEIPNIEVGEIADDKFLASAARIVQAAQMTAEEATAYFRSMGFEPHFATMTVESE